MIGSAETPERLTISLISASDLAFAFNNSVCKPVTSEALNPSLRIFSINYKYVYYIMVLEILSFIHGILSNVIDYMYDSNLFLFCDSNSGLITLADTKTLKNFLTSPIV